MRKILFNQDKYTSKDIISLVNYIYNYYCKIEGVEKDILTIVEFNKEYFDSDKHYPPNIVLKENFKDFKFIEETFNTEGEFSTYIKEKLKTFRDDYRQKLAIKYLEKGTPWEDRTKILEQMMKLEAELISVQQQDVTDIDEVDLEEKFKERENVGEGIKTNIPDIDEVTGGISDGKLCTIMGGPGSGKTSMAVNMSYLESMNVENSNNLFITLEIPETDLIFEMAIRHLYGKNVNISFLKTTKNLLNTEEKAKLIEQYKDFQKTHKSKMYIMDTNKINLTSLFSFKNQLVEIITKKKIKTVYFDHLHLLRDYKLQGYKDEREMVNDVIGMFRYLSVTYNVRFIMLSQVNKDAIKKVERNGGKYSMADMSEYNAIERDSTYIISLYSNDELKISSNIMFQLVKSRFSSTIELPTKTYIVPQFFVVGEVSYQIGDMIPDLEKQDSENNGTDYLDLFKE